jgi:hypothetical protein
VGDDDSDDGMGYEVLGLNMDRALGSQNKMWGRVDIKGR